MRWYLDTHKFMSEVTRKALQIIAERNITSESSPEEIVQAERALADAGVYQVVVCTVKLAVAVGAVVGVRCLVQEDEECRVTQSSGEACVKLVASFNEVLLSFLFVEGEEFFLYLLEFADEFLCAVAYGVVCSYQVKVVVVDDGPFDVRVCL